MYNLHRHSRTCALINYSYIITVSQQSPLVPETFSLVAVLGGINNHRGIGLAFYLVATAIDGDTERYIDDGRDESNQREKGDTQTTGAIRWGLVCRKHVAAGDSGRLTARHKERETH